MKVVLPVGAIAMALAGTSAEAIETNDPFLCAVTQVYECVDGRGCEAVLPEDVRAPTFLWVDVRKNALWVDKERPPSKISQVTTIEDRLILQGAEDGNPDQPDGTGWTLSIENATGRFTAAAALKQASIALFGACTELD